MTIAAPIVSVVKACYAANCDHPLALSIELLVIPSLLRILHCLSCALGAPARPAHWQYRSWVSIARQCRRFNAALAFDARTRHAPAQQMFLSFTDLFNQ
ncbi:MAG TPA: hypothetical protein VGI93_05395 [Steroidobacteraceae bacterium]